MELTKKTVNRADKRIYLNHKEIPLLEYFLPYPGEVPTRSTIAFPVLDMKFESDTNVIDVAIRRLRNKIDAGFEPKLIHTVRGMGYKLDVLDEAD